jgi:histidinol-phosphate/aromatic aminotransferase/cobyric acid decarboxylase-like protein
VIVLKSLGKNFGLHGIRAGYAVAHPQLARRLRQALPPWNVNALAELLIRRLPEHLPDYERGRRKVIQDRIRLQQRLDALPELTVFPSHANFVYASLPPALSAVALRNLLLTEFGILIRDCGNKAGSDDRYVRIAARPAEQVHLLLEALKTALGILGWHVSSAA